MKQSLIFIICFSVSLILKAQPNIQNCNVFPKNNIWNTPIDKLPIHPFSNTYINTIGATTSLRNDFGSGLWNNASIGIPYILVGGDQQKYQVSFEYADESDHSGYPIPENPPIEGGNQSTGDRHILIIDTNNCILYELYSAYLLENNDWSAGSGAIYDLNSDTLRPLGWTSADAAGLPIFPGLVKYDEVQSGEINHIIRFTVPKTKREYIWPARHFASSITDNNYPPMGLVMRLKANFDIEKLSPQAKVIAIALKKYGMILADNGSAWYMSGVPDERWDMDDLYTLRQIKGADFEAVDISSLMIEPNSGVAKQSASSIIFDNNSANIIVFPNPASDFITVISPSIKRGQVGMSDRVHIFDILGIEVAQTFSPVFNNNDFRFNCNDFYSNKNDFFGQKSVFSSQTRTSDLLRIDISNLPIGVYFIKIGDKVEKFVKK